MRLNFRLNIPQTHFALTFAQVFSCTDLVTNSEHFYSSIMELLEDLDEKDEVDQLLAWWNRQCFRPVWEIFTDLYARQIFPLYTKTGWLLSKESTLTHIWQKCLEHKEGAATAWFTGSYISYSGSILNSIFVFVFVWCVILMRTWTKVCMNTRKNGMSVLWLQMVTVFRLCMPAPTSTLAVAWERNDKKKHPGLT